MSEKIALVLAGGGAKGSYQAEVANRIVKEKDIGVVNGVSVGALNGAMLSQGKPDKLTDIWADLRKEDVWAGGHNAWRYFKLVVGWALGIYDPDPLHRLIQENFDPSDVEVPFKAGAVSLETGEYVPYEIRPETDYPQWKKRKARKFVVASSCVPVGVEPVEVDGELMIDGGTRNIAPIGDAIDEDPDRIIAIFNTRLDNKFDKPSKEPESVFGLGEWAFDIFLNELVRSDLRMARAVNSFQEKPGFNMDKYNHVPIDVIQPSAPIGEATDFSREAWHNRVEVAKKDVEAYLG